MRLVDDSGFLQPITGANLKIDLKTGAGANLSYDTGVNSNTLNLDATVTNTTLNSGCSWNGNPIGAANISNGQVSDTKFQRLNGLTSTILQSSMEDSDNDVCALDANGLVPTTNLPGSVGDTIEVAGLASLPATGDPLKIYATTDNNKSHRWSG